MPYTLEICSNSTQSALNAQAAGATQVELCSNLWEAGTTPSYGVIKTARALLDIKLLVLIRPRGGDFVYSDLELDIIKEDIIACKAMGVDGIVSGVLNKDNTIAIDQTRELIELTRPLPFTFHRAFDITPNLFQSLEELISLKVDRVLTSGGLKMAPDASEMIAKLNQQAANRITVLPGGGIEESNIGKLLRTGCTEFHMTCNVLSKSAAQVNTLQLNGSNSIPECDYLESSIEVIQRVDAMLKNHFEPHLAKQ